MNKPEGGAANHVRSSLPRSSLLAVGISVPIAIAAADAYALRMCRGEPDASVVYATYALFVGQTILLGGLVGSQVRRQPLWWGILAWGILLINLQVFALAAPDRWSPANTVGVAFASAQIGVLICVGILGTVVWPIRVPAVALALVSTVGFALMLSSSDSWYLVLMLQSVATGLVCLVLRWIGFRIEPAELSPGKEEGSRLQFSIRHLFYWTTSVAILVGLGRFVGWRGLLAIGMELTSVPEVIAFAPLLTLVSVLAMWGALGREAWWVRLGILLSMLPTVGALLGWSARLNSKTYMYRRLFPVQGADESIVMGVVWTILAGALFAGLLLVLRTSGSRLQRRLARAASNS